MGKKAFTEKLTGDQPPHLAPRTPAYPPLRQLVRVAAQATTPGIYNAFIVQRNPGGGYRDREASIPGRGGCRRARADRTRRLRAFPQATTQLVLGAGPA